MPDDAQIRANQLVGESLLRASRNGHVPALLRVLADQIEQCQSTVKRFAWDDEVDRIEIRLHVEKA